MPLNLNCLIRKVSGQSNAIAPPCITQYGRAIRTLGDAQDIANFVVLCSGRLGLGTLCLSWNPRIGE